MTAGRDVRHELGDLVDQARAELDSAVVKFDALTAMHELAWLVDRDVWSLEDVEPHLSTVDAARWRAALRNVAEVLDDDPDPTPDT